MHTELEINFDEIDYSTDEDDIMGLRGISLSFRETQTSFRIEMIPASIDVAMAEYNLTEFLTLNIIAEDQRAKQGGVCAQAYVYVRNTLPLFTNEFSYTVHYIQPAKL